VVNSSAPATTHEPTLPSAARSASEPASPHAPDQFQRSRFPSPNSVLISKASSAPISVMMASGSAALPRRRFHDHPAITSGNPNEAARPNAQTSP
jgi:hypothetical protein